MIHTLEKRKKRATIIVHELKKLFPSVKSALNYSTPLEFLIAVILSAQTTDKQVNKVTATFFQKYKTLDDYVKADPHEFEQDLKSINHYRNKAKNVLQTVKMIKEKYHGKIPETMEELLELPGVGRKTANVILGNIFKKPVGIAVDTHVRRLAKLYGLTDHTDPVKIEKDLMEIVPKEDWTNFTHLMIEYGRSYCSARKHDHKHCPLTKIVSSL
jgi:endonuclease III